MVSDAVWEKVASLLPGKASDSGVTAKGNRLFLQAVLWRVRGDVPANVEHGGRRGRV